MIKKSAWTRSKIEKATEAIIETANILERMKELIETKKLTIKSGQHTFTIDLSGTNPSVSISSSVRTALRSALGIQ